MEDTVEEDKQDSASVAEEDMVAEKDTVAEDVAVEHKAGMVDKMGERTLDLSWSLTWYV